MLMPILYLMLVYFIFVFLVSRTIVPHLGFTERIPEDIPASMREKIYELKLKSKNAREFLNNSYEYLGLRYHSERLKTLLRIDLLFKSLEKIWRMNGYIPCAQNNYLLKIFLVKSGLFKEEDIKTRYTIVNFFLHQYLTVKTDNEWIDVDVGEKQRGMVLGQHLKLFG